MLPTIQSDQIEMIISQRLLIDDFGRPLKIGRNDPCPCGKLRPNGLPMKYKDCCGKNA